MLNPDSPLVKPEVVFIEELLDEVSSGKLRVPRFQRPFVWNPPDMLYLFESIYRGYPIGSLLLWETSEKAESLDQIGPHSIPAAASGQLTYLLDGQQRLATLFGALRLQRDFPLGPRLTDWRWWIWFDLRKCEFAHVTNSKPPPFYMPLRAVLRTVDFLEEARRLQRECGEDASQLIPRAEKLAQTIKNYKVAIIRIKGGSLSEAVDIFSRLNSKGRQMTLDQMVSALTYKEGESPLNLAQRIDEIQMGLSDYHFENINRLTIFRSIVAAAGLDMHSSEWENLANRMSNKDLPAALNAAEKALTGAVSFLSEEVEVPSDRLLPYANQVLLLSRFFHFRATPTPEQKQILVRWFWMTSLSGWFAGANSTKINDALEEMRALAMNPKMRMRVMPLDEVSQPFPGRFDLRSARIRSLELCLLRMKPRDLASGRRLDAGELIRENGNEAFQYIFPRPGKDLVSLPANRILARRIRGKAIRERLLLLQESEKTAILESHGILPDAYKALEADDPQTFLRLRTRFLADCEREFLEPIGIVVPSLDSGDHGDPYADDIEDETR